MSPAGTYRVELLTIDRRKDRKGLTILCRDPLTANEHLLHPPSILTLMLDTSLRTQRSAFESPSVIRYVLEQTSVRLGH